MARRRTLKASPPGSTSWIYIENDGALVVEFYDHGREAEETFGHDVAFLLRVVPEHKPSLLEALRRESAETAIPKRPNLWHRLRARAGASIDTQLLDELERFGSYFEVRAWFEAEGVPYAHEFDSWA